MHVNKKKNFKKLIITKIVKYVFYTTKMYVKRIFSKTLIVFWNNECSLIKRIIRYVIPIPWH